MKRICFITTLDHNVGDDFVREGILHLLGQACGPFEVSCVHKHLPVTARPVGERIRALGFERLLGRIHRELPLRLTGRLDEVLPLSSRTDRILNCDVLVQSGAPVYWAHDRHACERNEWWMPLIERRWVPAAAGRPLLNLAAGTCQRFDSDGSEFAARPETLAYVRRFFDLSALTTVRDSLSVRVLGLAGRSAEQLPCTSLFGVDALGIRPVPGEYVVLNFRRPEIQDTLGLPVDGGRWERRFVEFAQRLAERRRCLLVCHDRQEHSEAARLLPGIPRFLSARHVDYLRVYAAARWGIVNRVHAGFALASLGKPAAIVGVDSRSRMAPAAGLESVFVDAADEDWLERTAGRLESEVSTYPDVVDSIKREARSRYVALLGNAVAGGKAA